MKTKVVSKIGRFSTEEIVIRVNMGFTTFKSAVNGSSFFCSLYSATHSVESDEKRMSPVLVTLKSHCDSDFECLKSASMKMNWMALI